jgi:1-aminocyclopropane-1-carboxylate deaminase/D-cysteine desulfhydrase-like pyridoxal-dependent ACC family enzyme
MDQSVLPPAWHSNVKDIRSRIAALPRVRLAITPTPLEEAPQLTKRLGGPQIFVKRDDLTGVAFGGNKTRNLEFRLAHALALSEKPDVVIVGLDLQSNSARQTIGSCNKLGLKTILILEGVAPDPIQGNLLVDFLLGADIRFAATRKDQRRLMDEAAGEVRAKGLVPHILNDNPMFEVASAVAYMECTIECLEQLASRGVAPTAIYMSSAGKGQAGLVLAQKIFRGRYKVYCCSATREHDVANRTAAIANRAAERLGLDIRVEPADVVNYDEYVGERYGVPTAAGVEAVRMFAETEGLILDPVYSGKCAAGMIDHIRQKRFTADNTVLFIHTGGTPAIFTYQHLWLDQARANPTREKTS